MSKRLIDLTTDDLVEIINNVIDKRDNKNKDDDTYIYCYSGIAKALNVSMSTVLRNKSIFEDAIERISPRKFRIKKIDCINLMKRNKLKL